MSKGLRVLVVEDEFLLASDLARLLSQLGCDVIGPAPSVAKAHALVERDRPDFALLDVNLGSERSTSLADMLLARGIPSALATGYGADQLPEPSLRNAPRIAKPVKVESLRRLLDDFGRDQSASDT